MRSTVKEMGMQKRIAILAVAGLVASAMGQASNATFVIESSNVVTPANTSTTISFFAAWDQPNPGDFVFSGADWDLVAEDGEFSNPIQHIPRDPCTCSPGTPMGNRVNGAALGQIHIPPLGIFGDPANPLLLAEYTWTATDFTPRSVNVFTEGTTLFFVTPAPGPPNVPLINSFSPGAGVIQVVPAPSALAVLGLGGLVALCRRR